MGTIGPIFTSGRWFLPSPKSLLRVGIGMQGPSIARGDPVATAEAASLDLFVGVNAPQFDLLDITLEPVAVDQTPGAVAIADVDDYP
jgi:hypothetical protein